MELKELFKRMPKSIVHEYCSRVTMEYVDYDKITRNKMFDKLLKFYSDYQNIIEICTVRELKYLELLLNNSKNINDKKYDWEKKTLIHKFLIWGVNDIFIPDDLKESIKQALDNVDYKIQAKMDELNEFLVAECRIQGYMYFEVLLQMASSLGILSQDELSHHMLFNKLFNYYVFIGQNDENEIYLIYNDYLDEVDLLKEKRKKLGIAGTRSISFDIYKSIFYTGYDLNNEIVKKFYDVRAKHNLMFIDSDVFKQALLQTKQASIYRYIDLFIHDENEKAEFIKLLESAIYEMPSGALNGFSSKERDEIKKEEEISKFKKIQGKVYQRNACLDKKDAKLFYKIYFGLLDYTNQQYNIVPALKIYNQKHLNPSLLQDIIEAFWENKSQLIFDFGLKNPFKFNKEELDITKNFVHGIRDNFVLATYEEEYTALLYDGKTYMIKGINDNLDNIIKYERLPLLVRTTIIPFRNYLIYDSILLETPIKFGLEFEQQVQKEYEKNIKYYHL